MFFFFLYATPTLSRVTVTGAHILMEDSVVGFTHCEKLTHVLGHKLHSKQANNR